MKSDQRRNEVAGRSSSRRGPDLVVIVLVALLLLTLGMFLGGWIGYPYGVLVLSFLIAGRVFQQRRGTNSRR